jgi:uroporphyrin-III C-methyltransferase
MSGREVPGVVHLVGAGPGAADLITVRGYRLVMSCDALVYDHLVAADLVEASPAKTKIYVGKVAGQHAMPQAKINALLVDLATREGGPSHIVRLKGGDPFVFGRGGEEAFACLEKGIPFSVVPGVSSGIAAPAAVGVPLTHRDFTRGVMFITGHARGDGDLALPWDALAGSRFTLVFFMGVSTIERIAKELIAHGLEPSTPALVVQEATTPSQRHVTAELSEVASAVQAAGIKAPALLVVGQVAGLATQLDGTRPSVPPKEPQGKRIEV